MKTRNSGMWVALATVTAGLALASPVSAAAPDGFGAWADGIAVSNQGMRKNGTSVLPDRSDLSAALGVAEGTQNIGTFYSLGMGGSTTFAFQNGISEGTFVVESTWTDYYYPTETAKVEVSTNGINYQEIGNITKEDGEVEIPAGFGCALFVRLTDTSNPALFEDTADGFDVDGVRSVGKPCVTGGEIPACFKISTIEAEKHKKIISKLMSMKAEKHKKAAADYINKKANKK